MDIESILKVLNAECGDQLKEKALDLIGQAKGKAPIVEPVPAMEAPPALVNHVKECQASEPPSQDPRKEFERMVELAISKALAGKRKLFPQTVVLADGAYISQEVAAYLFGISVPSLIEMMKRRPHLLKRVQPAKRVWIREEDVFNEWQRRVAIRKAKEAV